MLSEEVLKTSSRRCDKISTGTFPFVIGAVAFKAFPSGVLPMRGVCQDYEESWGSVSLFLHFLPSLLSAAAAAQLSDSYCERE